MPFKPALWRENAWHSSFMVVCVSIAVTSGHAADLSMLSDFGRPDITATKFATANGTANTVGIDQVGDLNVASVNQTGTEKNTIQLWQQGTELRLQIIQSGSDNELRLSQSSRQSQSDITQDGVGNQIAVQQSGANGILSGSQLGNENTLVLVQPSNSEFSFIQHGSQNQIQAELSAGQALQVEQTGNQMSVNITPLN